MDDDVEMIKKMILQQIKPINFGDELNVADILGEDSPEGLPVAASLLSTPSEELSSSPLKPVENIVCHICSKIFANTRYLKKHFTKHTGRFSCPSCNKIFSRKETKLKHIPRCKITKARPKKKMLDGQNKIGKYYCETCKKNFTRKENYDQHIMVHNGVQIVCNTCQKKLSSFKSYQRHKKIHEDPKYKISCQDCPSKFSLKSNLQRHIKLYQHKNQVICKKCDKNVKTDKNLQKHQSQDTTHICMLCPQVFCLESHLKSHLKNDHPNLWFKCKECPSTPFMTRAVTHLQEHARRHHSIEFPECEFFKDGWFMIISN